MSDIEVLPSILTDDWRSTESGPGVSLWWLGQAGFICPIRSRENTLERRFLTSA